MAIVETDPAFDTLAHVRTLREAGVERKQAEAHAEAARALRAGLATKADLAVIEADIATIKARLDMFATKADLAVIEARLDTFATKADLAAFATKADLDGFATKADLAAFATKADLDGFATKADLNAGLSGLRADIYRVLWMQTGAFVAAMTALIAAFKLFG